MITALRVKSISYLLLVAGKTEYHINPIKCPGGVAFHGREAFFTASGVNQSLINSIKVTGYTCRGSNYTVFASLLNSGQLLKEKNLL